MITEQTVIPSTKTEADIEAFEADVEAIETAYRQAQFLKAFADPTRLRILRLLEKAQGTMHVELIVIALGNLAQPTISHHLRILRDAGIVTARKKGLYSYYMLRKNVIMRQAQRLIAERGIGGGIDEQQ